MTTYYIHIQNSPFNKRIKYVFEFIQKHPLSNKKVSFKYKKTNHNHTISYGSNSDMDFIIPAQALIFNTKPTHPDALIFNAYQHKELTLFSVESRKKATEDFLLGNQFSFDIIETIFFHISRYEEHVIVPDMKADWGTASKENHFIPRNNLQEIPLVDHLVFAFLEAIRAQPKKKKTTYRLTHDIDIPYKLPSFYKFIKASVRLVLIERKGLRAQQNLFSIYRKMKQGTGKDPYDTFDWLFRKEKLEKVAYFMTGGVTKFDNFYKIDSESSKELIKLAQKRGYQIGLHPSYEAYHRADLYQAEKEKLEEIIGEKVILSRQHYLRFQFPKTAQIIEHQGIKDDATLGYRDKIGFRCGTGFGYRLYNFEQEEAYDFVEMPLVVMEVGLLKQNSYKVQEAKKQLVSFIHKNKHLTKVTFLFHNSFFDPSEIDSKGMKELYEFVYRLK